MHCSRESLPVDDDVTMEAVLPLQLDSRGVGRGTSIGKEGREEKKEKEEKGKQSEKPGVPRRWLR
jgi:hypothetical protein